MSKLLFVVNGAVPSPVGDGVRVGTWLWVETMLGLGFEPIVVPYRLPPASFATLAADRLRLNAKGVRVCDDLADRPKEAWPRLSLVVRAILPLRGVSCPHLGMDRAVLRGIAEREAPLVVIAYDTAAVAVLPGLADKWQCIAVLVDLPESLLESRRLGIHQMKGIKWWKEVLQLVGMRKAREWLIEDIGCVSAVVEHAWVHAEELKRRTRTQVVYVPHCMPGPEDPGAVNQEPEHADSYRLLIMGSLKGATSRLGFEYLLDQLLPRLRAVCGSLDRPIRIRIVGHGEMLASLRTRLMLQSEVEFGPFASTREAIEREYATCHAVLVPIPVKVGFRTRIAEAFAYGKCVIAHSANCQGMPEVVDQVNAMCAEDPGELAQRIITVLGDRTLRQILGNSARQTFLNHYSLEAMKRSVEPLLKSIISLAESKHANRVGSGQ